MKSKQILSLSDLAFIERVYKSCKTSEHREVYFAWEARLFKQVAKNSSYGALKTEKYLADRLR